MNGSVPSNPASIMTQVCCAPCCQNARREAAVYAMKNPGISPPPRTNMANPFAVLQAQLAGWRPSVYYFQNIDQTYNLLPRHTMATQHHKDGETTWTLQTSENDEKPQYFAQSAFGCPQSDQTFFDEQSNYHPEESMLFNPLDRYAHGGTPRSMETLTKAFEPSDARSSGSASLPYIGKCEEGTSLSKIQTNIDPNQFQLVRREDWSRASITGYGNDDDDDEDDAISPASTDATSHGPYTPIGLEGDTGFPEAAMRRFSQELSTSCGSTGAEMFKGMDHMFDFSSTSREPAKPKQIIAVPPFTSFTHDSHSNTAHGGLPYTGNDTYGYSNSGESTLLRHANFRDVNGLAISPAAALPASKQRGSTGTTAIPEVQTQPDEGEHSDSTPFTQRDKLLLDMREQGLTYKEIKRRGKFLAAESTLRGRVRQLTKHKSERVRKPHWTENDIRLLRSAVSYHRKLREEGAYVRHRDGKLPWKQIAERMRNDGASYMFAPATCAKKYEEIGGH